MSAELIRRHNGVDTYIEQDADLIRLATVEWVPDDLLKRLAESRNAERRAPLGDANGGWQKVMELPLAHAFSRIAPENWEDKREWKKLVNDSSLRAFRADGNHRVF